MRHHIVFFALGFIMMLGFSACNSSNNEGTAFQDWDSNQDELLDNNEFDNAFTNSPYFDNWNQDGDQYISENEFYQSYAAMIDENEDGNISNEEWDAAVNSYFSGYDFKVENLMEEWDQNSDGNLSKEEITSSLAESDYFDEWDSDGDEQLSEKEFAKGTFSTWDTDGDGLVQAEEYADWYDSGF
ncbi:Ca2+-binding EF-hand superfamily protein [Catalinimonas alkaloidigena]|uniref:hypothetical protein n=1 Tax=Catalinimonas alkaloidigena TaxID=1075417 RepID=UPI002405F04A|nr:hypothetical protein [Catalinimonas alkaloidigena]MDF9795688.1 Ca2+-binding EF-hand superfamily protein [Catalinimonas alkaloidigena]